MNLSGIAKNKTIKQIADKWNVTEAVINRAIYRGAKIEMEHTKSMIVARKIAKDHIYEMGTRYYPELIKLEKKLKR